MIGWMGEKEGHGGPVIEGIVPMQTYASVTVWRVVGAAGKCLDAHLEEQGKE